jgi:hypothetical protein
MEDPPNPEVSFAVSLQADIHAGIRVKGLSIGAHHMAGSQYDSVADEIPTAARPIVGDKYFGYVVGIGNHARCLFSVPRAALWAT